jgi:hypothetical protein
VCHLSAKLAAVSLQPVSCTYQCYVLITRSLLCVLELLHLLHLLHQQLLLLLLL